MSAMTLSPLPAKFAETRDALHRLAVYVISPAQRLQNGEIILHATPGGFSTFAFDGRVIGVDGADLVVDGAHHPIGSLNDAARLAGIAPDVAQQEQFDVPPHGDLDEPLAVDAAAARALGAWYAFVRPRCWTTCVPMPARPTMRRSSASGPSTSTPRSTSATPAANRRATYGASPGDRDHAEPYLYASPWAGRVDAFFDDPDFEGAARTRRQLAAEADARGRRSPSCARPVSGCDGRRVWIQPVRCGPRQADCTKRPREG